MDESADWERLLSRIRAGKCTPFLGAGAPSEMNLPTAAEIASEWAEEHGYPYADRTNLAAVAQFVAIAKKIAPKHLLVDRLLAAQARPRTGSGDPYTLLAALPIAAYVTTNYDDLMSEALRNNGREPRLELCRWNKASQLPSVFAGDYEPTPSSPVIYHLHGHQSIPNSLVLTDDDYLDFLLTAFSDRSLIPPVIQAAIAGRSMLFIGYRLYDWNFRVLFRRFAEAGLQRANFAVLRPPAADGDGLDFQRQVEYFRRLGIHTFVGSAAEFAAELRQRWSRDGA